MTLKQEYKRQLVDSLLGCPSVSDESARDSLINNLPDDIKNSIKRNTINRVEVFNIVNRCLDFENGIELLISTVRTFEGSSMPMKNVYKTIPYILDINAVIKNESLCDLFEIFSGIIISEGDMIACLPKEFKADAADVTTWFIIKYLCEIPYQPNNTLPIQVFVENIADKIHNKEAVQRLMKWNKDVASYLEDTLDNRENEPEAIHASTIGSFEGLTRSSSSVTSTFEDDNISIEELTDNVDVENDSSEQGDSVNVSTLLNTAKNIFDGG